MSKNGGRRARKLRRQIVASLGAACACCGETVPHALTVDHRLNDGRRERREFPGVRDLYTK